MTLGSPQLPLPSWLSSNPTIPQTPTSKTLNLTLRTSNVVEEPKRSAEDLLLIKNGSSSSRYCLCCPRRHFLGLGAVLGTSAFPSFASAEDPMAVLNKIHPPRPDWYEELYALVLEKATNHMKQSLFCGQIAAYKSELLGSLSLRGKVEKILEIGIGTAPNLKYYAHHDAGVNVVGVDPNQKMEKYARLAAENVGLPASNFKFLQAVPVFFFFFFKFNLDILKYDLLMQVAEALPLDDASVDAVIGTLVLCSVQDVDRALQEVKRVLKPGGFYVFIEHVAAKDGSILRYVQGILDPLQQSVADGCHLTRNTATNIGRAGFACFDLHEATFSTTSLINPQIYGIAYR